MHSRSPLAALQTARNRFRSALRFAGLMLALCIAGPAQAQVSSSKIAADLKTVLNASNFSSAGSSVGVPVVEAGSLASSLATSGSTSSASKAAEEAAAASSSAARAAQSQAPVVRPTILLVEVLGFGERNCRETDRECLGR